MTILHASTDPDLLTRLRQMLSSAARADIAVGYFFISGFSQVVDDLARLNKTRILVGRADQPTLEAVAAGLHQADALRTQLELDQTVPRSQRDEIANEAASGIAKSVAAMPQTDTSQKCRGETTSTGVLGPAGSARIPQGVSPRQGLPLLVRRPRRTW